MSWLIEIDTQLFIFLNFKIQNRFLDLIMPFVTEIDNWRIVIGIGWLLLMILGGKKGRQVGLGLILVIVLSDQSSSSWVKPLVQRIRPCHVVQPLHLLVDCSAAYSFPSSHAANMFGAAAFLTLFYRNSAWVFFPLAILIGYSRIYVGVHYPFDVLGGAILGMVSAVAVRALLRLPFRPLAEKLKILRPASKPATSAADSAPD